MSVSPRGGWFRRIVWTACLATAAGLGARADAGTYSQLIVFGDSLSDTGNDAVLAAEGGGAMPSVYSDGRFSNGPNWADYLSAKLGVADPKPSLSGGTNYAYGFAETGAGTSVSPPEFGTQPPRPEP